MVLTIFVILLCYYMYKLNIKGNNSHQNSFRKTSWKVIKIKKNKGKIDTQSPISWLDGTI